MITVHSINNSSVDGKHISRVSWEESRSKDDPAPLIDILKIDAPVNELPMATFTIRCTILEREIFTSARDHHIWARTSRVDDPVTWKIPACLYDEGIVPDDVILNIKHKIESDLLKGIPQDEARLNIPICSYTSFTTTMDLRSVVKMIKYLRHLGSLRKELTTQLNSTADDLYMSVLLPLVNMDQEAADAILHTYMLAEFLHKFEYEDGSTQRVGNFLVVSTETTLSLRTQAIRHRTYHVADNILDMILTGNDPWLIRIGDKIKIQISAPIDIWMKTISKRQCWIAHHGLWKPVIDAASPHLPISESDLPCSSSGACPYVRDAELRFTDKDPGSPCPKFVRIYDKQLTTELFDAMTREASFKPSFWSGMIEGCRANIK